MIIINHAYWRRGVAFCLSVCLSVFQRDISKTDAIITKLYIDMFQDVSGKEIHLFWGHNVKGQGHESQNIVSAGLF